MREAEQELFHPVSKTAPLPEFTGELGGQSPFQGKDPALHGRDSLIDTNFMVRFERTEKQLYFMVAKYKEVLELYRELVSQLQPLFGNQASGMRIR